MNKALSPAGQALPDDVVAINAGSPAKKWSLEQLLTLSVRKQPASAAITLIKVAQRNLEALEEIAA